MKSTKVSICNDLEIDLPLLLKTRLLIQANSGGGKSFLLRRLAEQMFGKVPVIIIDPEGEFATLREKFGYVLVGNGGETPADLRSAAMVAHKLLELRASAVCDLYELKPQARHQWVKLFLEAMIDAPKKLWGPTVVIVDEAHNFAPEGKAGESVASGAMVDLATRGRKRGYCAVFATQRLGKLRKDAAAELMNVMIGMTFIDIDRERAAESLGVGRDEKRAFNDEIKMLGEGYFYCLGRAIAKERTMIKVGGVSTTHPEAGGTKFSASPPPAPDAIKGMLPKLADLPKAAEEKAKTEADLKREISRLNTELSLACKQVPKPETTVVTKNVIDDATREAMERMNSSLGRMDEVAIDLERAINEAKVIKQGFQKIESFLSRNNTGNKIGAARVPSARPVTARPAPPPREHGDVDRNRSVTGGAKRMLVALAQRSPLSDRQLGVRAGLALSGTFDSYLSTLRTLDYVIGERSALEITQAGIDAIGHYDPLPTGQALLQHWLNHSKVTGAAKRMLQSLADIYPITMNDKELSEAAGIALSGTFDSYLSTLRTLELVTGKRDALKASDEFFND